MKRKFKQWWSTISISTNWTIISHLNSLTQKKTMTYEAGNKGPGLEQVQE